jgi:hypothetical protein
MLVTCIIFMLMFCVYRLREEIHDRLSDIEYGEAAMTAGGKAKGSASARQEVSRACG